MSRLILRADAGVRIGTGHVMRCLALAQAWIAAGGEAVFVCGALSSAMKERLCLEGVRVEEPCPGARNVAEEIGCGWTDGVFRDWVALDGYAFGSEAQRGVFDAGLPLLAFDDYQHVNPCWADLILNPNPAARATDYMCERADTELLLGPAFAVLRREFVAASAVVHPTGCPLRVLVTMGGSDPDNVTVRVLESFSGGPPVELRVVVGALNPHRASIEMALARSALGGELISAVKDMRGLMEWADLAVSAGGHTCWEMAYMGLPTVVLQTAVNQAKAVEGLSAAGVLVDLGPVDRLSAEAIRSGIQGICASAEYRAAMASRGRDLVDGLGGRRVVDRMKARQLKFRNAESGDCAWVWELSNDPMVRKASFMSESIPWESHVAWFERQLEDRECHFLLIESDTGVKVGQCRFERTDNKTTISVSLHACIRGSGFAATVISEACARRRNLKPDEAIHACIREENAVSRRAFARAGFLEAGRSTRNGAIAIHMKLQVTG